MSKTKTHARLLETNNGTFYAEFVTKTGQTIKTETGSKSEALISLANIDQYKANPVRINLQ